MAWWQKKPTKKNEPDKTQYTVHSPNHDPKLVRKSSPNYLCFLSIDPGIVNIAISIERRYNDRWIECIYCAIADMTKYGTLCTNKGFDIRPGFTEFNVVYGNLFSFLDLTKPFFDDIDYVVIERQIPINYARVRVSQHMITYYMMKLQDRPKRPMIIEVDPRLKGKMLGSPRGINEKALKDWACGEAKKICLARGDQRRHDMIKARKGRKKEDDDIADTIVQLEALCMLWGLPVTNYQDNR